jgi:hypothetical protein
MNNSLNVAFNKNGSIAVIIGYFEQFVVLELEKNETKPDQIFIKRQ